MTASLCYADLGSMLPSTGGEYEYLKFAYGKKASFSCAWYSFWIKHPSSTAIVATVFGNYIVTLCTDIEDTSGNIEAKKTAAILLVLLLTGVNCLNIRESSTLNNVLTVIKLSVIFFLVVAAVGYVAGKNSDNAR